MVFFRCFSLCWFFLICWGVLFRCFFRFFRFCSVLLCVVRNLRVCLRLVLVIFWLVLVSLCLVSLLRFCWMVLVEGGLDWVRSGGLVR